MREQKGHHELLNIVKHRHVLLHTSVSYTGALPLGLTSRVRLAMIPSGDDCCCYLMVSSNERENDTASF